MDAGNNGGIVKRSASFAEAGVTAENVERIELIGNPYKSFDPKEDFNSYRDGFRINDKVIVVVKTFIDLSDYVSQTIDEAILTPEPPILTANDEEDTLSASHDLGIGQIEVSVNNGFYTPYTGTISVGNIDRAQGYYKIRTKAAVGRNASAVVESPAFTYSAPPLHLSNFSAADNVALGDYTPDIGSGWTVSAGSMKIVSNKAVTDGAAGSANNYYASTPITVGANYKITAVSESAANGMYRQLFLKVNSDLTDGIAINISENAVDVIELISGTPTTTSFQLPGGAPTGLSSATFEVTVTGSSLSLKKDNVAYTKISGGATSMTMAASHSGGLFGIGNANTGAVTPGAVKFDKFMAQAA